MKYKFELVREMPGRKIFENDFYQVTIWAKDAFATNVNSFVIKPKNPFYPKISFVCQEPYEENCVISIPNRSVLLGDVDSALERIEIARRSGNRLIAQLNEMIER